MSAIALNTRDLTLMPDSDPGMWMAVVGGIAAFSAFAGSAGTWLFRSRDTAKQDGQSLGEIRAWISEAKQQAREMEARLSLRIASLELHRDNTATKQDLKDAVSDIKERLSEVVSEVRENRAVVHRVIPPT